jgi:hypothetical protein
VHAFRTGTEQECALCVTFDPFAKSPATVRSLRTPTGWSRREADIAGAGLGRLSWAESGPTGAAVEGPVSRPKRSFRFEREIGFTARTRSSRPPTERLPPIQTRLSATLYKTAGICSCDIRPKPTVLECYVAPKGKVGEGRGVSFGASVGKGP